MEDKKKVKRDKTSILISLFSLLIAALSLVSSMRETLYPLEKLDAIFPDFTLRTSPFTDERIIFYYNSDKIEFHIAFMSSLTITNRSMFKTHLTSITYKDNYGEEYSGSVFGFFSNPTLNHTPITIVNDFNSSPFLLASGNTLKLEIFFSKVMDSTVQDLIFDYVGEESEDWYSIPIVTLYDLLEPESLDIYGNPCEYFINENGKRDIRYADDVDIWSSDYTISTQRGNEFVITACFTNPTE